jgi:ABC-2 type transporter
MIFFLATLITSTIFITDRLEGVWDRTLVAGISTSELLLAHIITQSTVMLVQCMEIVVLSAFIFNTVNQGDNFTVIFLLMLLGFAGMLYGLFISIFCDSHTMANFMATGSFYPMIILCGKLPIFSSSKRSHLKFHQQASSGRSKECRCIFSTLHSSCHSPCHPSRFETFWRKGGPSRTLQ